MNLIISFGHQRLRAEWTLGPDKSLNNGWDATYNTSDSTVTASNSSSHWNGTITANGGDVTFWFQGDNSSAPADVISSFTLNGAACN